MSTNEKTEEIGIVIYNFFQKMGFPTELKNFYIEEKTAYLKLKTEEPKVLIGKNGRTLNDIQKLLGVVLRKKVLENFFIDVDIDGYKEKKTEYLRELAREIADEVALTKKERVLDPMTSYERRIIHLELVNRPDVVSNSLGEGRERRVVISPKK